MHVEFRLLLENCLQERVSELAASVELPPELVTETLAQVCPAEVAALPRSVVGRLDRDGVTSPVIFELAARLSRVSGRQLLPGPLSHKVVELLLSYGSARDHFEISVGGAGYINSTATDSFVQQYFSVLMADPRRLFGEKSVFSPPSTSVDHDGESSYKVLPVDWSDMEVLSALVPQSDAQLLLRECSAGDRQKFGFKLMLLALLADPELSATSYLKGIGGSENIPWYLRRFLDDSRSWLAKLQRVGSSNPSPSQLSGAGGSGSQLTDNYCRWGAEHLCWLRHRVEVAGRTGRVFEVVGAVVRIIRSFYSFYNRPEYRALTGGNAAAISKAEDSGLAEVRTTIAQYVALQRTVVEQGLRLVGW